MNTPSSPEVIDVISDVVCPWCYIGKRHLEASLDKIAPESHPLIRWHPFQLNPDLPAQGIDRRSYLETKFGGADRAAQIYERVRAAGRAAGLELDFDRIERQPNTIDAHRLIAWAQAEGQDADALVEALFRAYFIEGRFIGDRSVLAELAQTCGYDADHAKAMLDSDFGLADIEEMGQRTRQMGITGVPFFVFNERVGVSGAQGALTLADALVKSREAA